MATSLNKELVPVEDFVFDGFARRFQRVMGLPCVWKSANDEVQVLKRTGSQLRYPYATLFHEFTTLDETRGSTHAASRRGVPVLVGSDRKRSFNTFYLQSKFGVKIEVFEDSSDRRKRHGHKLLLAGRNGWLKFAVGYGNQSFEIGIEAFPTSIDFPEATSDESGEKRFTFETHVVIAGYISDSVLSEQQIVDTLDVSTLVGGGTIENSDLAFPSQQHTFSSPTSEAIE